MSDTERTEIKDIDYANGNERQTVKITEDNMSDVIFDFDLEVEDNIKALNLYHDTKGSIETMEILKKLSSMYQFSGTKILRTVLYNICMGSKISPYLKSIAATGLYAVKDDDKYVYETIIHIYPEVKEDTHIGTPYLIELVKMLMTSKDHKETTRGMFNSIVNDQELECDYRYKTVLSLEDMFNNLSDDKRSTLKRKQKLIKYFLLEAFISFMTTQKNMTMYRILASQYLLQNLKIKDDIRELCESTLLDFASDNDLDYNLRADAADALLGLGCEKNKEAARDIINLLGRDNRVTRTIFDNAQNVHNTSIEKSVEEALKFLATVKPPNITLDSNGNEIQTTNPEDAMPITYEYVEGKILKLIKDEKERKKIGKDEKYEREEKIVAALNRIYMDRVFHGVFNFTLTQILIRVWSYIHTHKHSEEIKKRLLEELEEMSGTCSSGFASRLVNAISAFGDFTMTISWRDQIISNFTAKLNNKARDIDNLRFQEKVLEEMTLDTTEYESRKNFLKFMRHNLSEIREEMAVEFRPHISDNDFDLYFRSAISIYETGGYV